MFSTRVVFISRPRCSFFFSLDGMLVFSFSEQALRHSVLGAGRIHLELT